MRRLCASPLNIFHDVPTPAEQRREIYFMQAPPQLSVDLRQYIEASTDKYASCLHALDGTGSITQPFATLRFHHLRLDANGEPKFKELAHVLADHIVEYCFSARRRNGAQKPHEISKLNREARSYCRKFATSGEAGEMLLYFLLEAVLGAPQMVAKMELKTNPRMEGHGSDGIHLKWHNADNLIDIFFGEAKLEQSIYSALDSVLESLEKFHQDKLMEHEFGMVTSFYKHADDKTREAVLALVDRQSPGNNCRINHACLVGYNWDEYTKLGQGHAAKLEADFRARYTSDLPRLTELLQKRLSKFSKPTLRFEVFFLPFRTVQEFRDAFNEAL